MEEHGRCPYCDQGTYLDFAATQLLLTRETQAAIGNAAPTHVRSAVCKLCSRRIVELGTLYEGQLAFVSAHTYPVRQKRSKIASEVPEELATDFLEAEAVLELSPRASAALSRRCLERMLRQHLQVSGGDLSQLIDQAIKTLPQQLAASIDAVRVVGNFAAHPGKQALSSILVDVEPGEAQWSLDVLLELFDFYFVQPARLQAKRDAINQKLKESGRKEMKGS